MDVIAVLKWKIVLILFIYRVYMSTLGSESIAASCDHHHVVRRVSQDDVLETSSECAAKTWSQLLQPCFQIYHGISQIRGRFLWSKLRFTSSGRPGERETSTEAGIKEAKKSRVNGFATCTLAFHNPLCVTAVMTPYRRAFPAALPFWKVTESLRKTASFFSTRPTSKTSKLLRLQAPPRAPTDRLKTTPRLLHLSPWPRFRTSPGSQSLCRNCPWALCCWSSPSSGRTCWRAAPTGWGSRWPASPCCPGRASTWTPPRRWSPSSRRTPRRPPPPLCSRPASCSRTSPDLWGGREEQWPFHLIIPRNQRCYSCFTHDQPFLGTSPQRKMVKKVTFDPPTLCWEHPEQFFTLTSFFSVVGKSENSLKPTW